ncbi:MAG: L-rhamnose mutarotase [Propionicimonas sp.]
MTEQLRRVCFQLQVRPEAISEYRRRHAAIWPEMLTALRATGWRNYSLFLRPDGLVIGYFETGNLDAALAGMAALEVNTRWQAEMAALFIPTQQGVDDGLVELTEVFNLDQQLAAAEPAHS